MTEQSDVLTVMEAFRIGRDAALAWCAAYTASGSADHIGIFVTDCVLAGATFDPRTGTVGPPEALRVLDASEW